MRTATSPPRTSASTTCSIRTGMRSSSGTSIRRRTTSISSRAASNSAFFGEEPPEPVEEDDEQDERLLARHRDAGDLLVDEGREAPQARRVLVEGIRRLGQERKEKAERGGEDERGERVAGAATRR